jgi:nitrous oxide reductase accessory protein NosL
VIGSDTLGPMGHELVPLASEAEAREFLKDHHGRRVLRFDEVTPALLEQLDRGVFE